METASKVARSGSAAASKSPVIAKDTDPSGDSTASSSIDDDGLLEAALRKRCARREAIADER